MLGEDRMISVLEYRILNMLWVVVQWECILAGYILGSWNHSNS